MAKKRSYKFRKPKVESTAGDPVATFSGAVVDDFVPAAEVAAVAVEPREWRLLGTGSKKVLVKDDGANFRCLCGKLLPASRTCEQLRCVCARVWKV
jgi:hypothetical protein